MKLEFFMAMDPPTITHQEKQVAVRNGKPVFYEPAELKAARQKLTDYLSLHKPDKKMDGPLELVTTWCFPTENQNRVGQYRTIKPDTDNLNKLLKDCMTRVGFWNDDAQVCREIIEKFWADRNKAGIYVRITQL